MLQISDYGQKWFYKTCCLGKEVGAEFLVDFNVCSKEKGVYSHSLCPRAPE